MLSIHDGESVLLVRLINAIQSSHRLINGAYILIKTSQHAWHGYAKIPWDKNTYLFAIIMIYQKS